jgi:hypothetical protein
VGNRREEECEDKGCEVEHCEKSRVVGGCDWDVTDEPSR